MSFERQGLSLNLLSNMAVASGGPAVPAPPFKLCAPHFIFGSRNYHEAVELLCAVIDSQ